MTAVSEVVSVFRAAHKPFIYGGFKNVTADEVENGTVVTEGDTCAALMTTVKAPRKYVGFDGRTTTIDSGDVLITDFACLEAASGEKLVRNLLLNSTKRSLFRVQTVWIEIYEEDQISKGVLQELDFQYVATKIASSSEIRGLYRYPRLGSDYQYPLEQSATAVALKHGFMPPDGLAEVRAELKPFSSFWEPVASNYNKRGSWNAFLLRGYQDDPKTLRRPSDVTASPLRNTSIADQFPATWKFIDQLPGDKERIWFIQLRAGGTLARHTDLFYKGIGIDDGKLVRFHVPIVTDAPNVIFRGWDARGRTTEKTFGEGDLFYLDFRKPHAVVNKSSADRIHLVVDIFSCREIREWIRDGVAAELKSSV